MNNLIKILLISAATNLFKLTATTGDDVAKIDSALRGRTYFAPKQVVKQEFEEEAEEAEEKDEIERDSSSISSSDSSIFSEISQSSDSSSDIRSELPCNRRVPRPVQPVYYQRPWCPGQVMASIVPRAMDPIYNWLEPETCALFASHFGGVSVLVGELGGPDFCSAGPQKVFSNYTIVRSLSVNEPIYAMTKFGPDATEYAVAAGPIIYPQGNIMYISLAKEVTKLPQVCGKELLY